MRAVKQIFKPFLPAFLALAVVSCAKTPVTPTPQPYQQQVYTPAMPAPDANRAPVVAEPVVTSVVKVALLVPMSGRDAALGRAMQDAATLALYDKYATLSPNMASTRVEILPKDSGDTPETAVSAAKAAIDEGAAIILGPVFSDAVRAVAPVAKANNRQVISFSNNQAVAAPGVYVFGFSPEQQTVRIVTYMVKQKLQVAALVPNSPFGTTVLETAKAAAQASGGAIGPVSMYLPRGMGAAEAAEALQKDAVPFNALFIPEVGPTLNTLLSALAARGIDGKSTQLLGTGMWDDPSIATHHDLEGALFASSPPAGAQAFVNRFRSAYGYAPPRVASLAYDAVTLSVTLATSGRGFEASTLTQPGGFNAPANGAFRLRENGVSERGLAILRIRGGGYEVVEPPPATFK